MVLIFLVFDRVNHKSGSKRKLKNRHHIMVHKTKPVRVYTVLRESLKMIIQFVRRLLNAFITFFEVLENGVINIRP